MVTVEELRAQYAETTDQVAASSLRSSPIFRKYVRPCCAEILGTIILVFASSLSAIAAPETARPVVVSLVQGATIAFLYGSLVPISGGHFNPAVSFAAWLGGGMSFIILLFFMVCQVLGAFVGALLFRAVLLRNVYLVSAAATAPAINFANTTIGQALLIELIGSFIWAMTVLLTIVDGNKPPQLASSFIGSAVFIASLLSYNLTKAILNPARAFGSTLAFSVFADGDWQDHYIFWVGPFLGAAFAALLYRLLYANDEKRVLFKK